MEAELGAEEGDGPVDAGPLTRGTGEVVRDLAHERADARLKLRIALDGRLRRRPQVDQEADGVLPGERPAVRVDVAKDRRAVGRPAPAEVVGNRGKRLQAVGQPGGEKLDAGRQIGGSRRERLVSEHAIVYQFSQRRAPVP